MLKRCLCSLAYLHIVVEAAMLVRAQKVVGVAPSAVMVEGEVGATVNMLSLRLGALLRLQQLNPRLGKGSDQLRWHGVNSVGLTAILLKSLSNIRTARDIRRT
uniref:Secreted protein n=1 Tax=Opuntia streptacantha TaxID=393608 RepID=A0A7C9D589_OPUST